MATCCNTVLTRIEKIKKNQIVNRGSSPYDQMPVPENGQNHVAAPTLPSADMTPFVNPNMGGGAGGNQEIPSPSAPEGAPELIPNAPTFPVPANPLLPPGYQEILDFNSVQYVNGFYRTQIGRYVRVEQLMGSNTIDTQEGFLIGVGINYIILQEAPTGNILVVDIYGIKNMYIYYNYRANPFEPFNMNTSAMSAAEGELPEEER
ncbi:hypothetical protein LI177_08930 [bacterium 210820-DFI.6.37]|nr:hypothetical protein [bacterium 210820-DFI.6.37]